MYFVKFENTHLPYCTLELGKNWFCCWF